MLWRCLSLLGQGLLKVCFGGCVEGRGSALNSPTLSLLSLCPGESSTRREMGQGIDLGR